MLCILFNNLFVKEYNILHNDYNLFVLLVVFRHINHDMKYIFISFLVFSLFSCSEMEDANQDICIPIFCGDVINDQVNLTIYNDTGIDFDEFYWDIGGTTDSLEFFPLEQFACWTNHESLTNSYFYAKGKSGNAIFELDTIRVDSVDIRTIKTGNFALEVYRVDDSNNLFSVLIDDYSGECRGFK